MEDRAQIEEGWWQAGMPVGGLRGPVIATVLSVIQIEHEYVWLCSRTTHRLVRCW